MDEQLLWTVAICITAVSLVSAVFVLIWYFKKIRPIRKETVKDSAGAAPDTEQALKRWRFLAVAWPVLCMAFLGIIIFQSVRGTEGRVATDAAFTVIPLIFFGIGMAQRHRLLKERRFATVLTTATVVSAGRRTHGGERHYFPEYEFQAGQETYHVTSPSGYGSCFVGEGRQVELYYAPDNPRVFYVPIMQKHDKRWSALLCGTGILWPLAGFFAPQIRAALWFLY